MPEVSEPGRRRLSVADTQMLEYRRPGSSVWTGCSWLLEFEGSCPDISELREHVASRLSYLPALEERVARPRLPTARPRWVRDPDFDLTYHVREAGTEFTGENGWGRLVDERMGTPLDPSRPLWQLWLAAGKGGERFAIVLHHDHALADGHSALHALRVLFAPDPPRDAALTRQRGPRLRALLEGVHSIASVLRHTYPPAPRVEALNQPLGSYRHALRTDIQMSDVMEIAIGLGCFPNEVYLTAVSGGLQRWLAGRGVQTDGLTLQVGIPTKTAARNERQELGNLFSGVRLPLPLDDVDVVSRLRLVQANAKRIREGRIARGGELLYRAKKVLPRQLLRTLGRIEWGPRALNLVVSHMALPGDLGELLGRPLKRVYCWTLLFEGQAISVVAAQGLDSTMTVNLLVDPDRVPDAEVLLAGIAETIEALRAASAEESAVIAR